MHASVRRKGLRRAARAKEAQKVAAERDTEDTGDTGDSEDTEDKTVEKEKEVKEVSVEHALIVAKLVTIKPIAPVLRTPNTFPA